MAEAIVFQIDVQPITGQLASLGKSIEDTKVRFEQLKKENGQYDEQTIATNAALKVMQKEYRSLETVLTNQSAAIGEVVKATSKNLDIKKIESNSIDTNRKLYNSLYGEYVRADKIQREKMIPTIKALSDELKKQESAVGDTRRNVGNYSEGFKDAFTQISSGIPALKGFQTAQTGVNAALSANPIGGVVTLLFALKEIVGGNAQVADALTFAFDGLTKCFNFIIDTIVDTVTNFDKLTAAIKNPIKFIKDFATGTAEAAKEGYEASKALDEFVVSNARTAAAIKENDLQIQALTKSLKDRTKSEQERIKIANTIADLEIENSKRSKKLAQDELDAEALRLKGRTKSAEDEAKLIELSSNVKQAAAEVDIANSQRQTRINILLEKEQRTAIIKEKKDSSAELLKLQEEFLLSEREKIEKGFDDKAAVITGNSEKEIQLLAAINTAKEAALTKFDTEAEAKRIAAEEKAIADRFAIASKALNEQTALNQTLLENELKAVDLSVASEQDKANRKNEINLKYLEQQLKLAVELANIDNELTDQEIANIEKVKLAITELKQKASEPTPKISEVLGIDEKELSNAASALGGFQQLVSSLSQTFSAINQQRISDIESQYDTEIDNVNRSALNKEEKENKIRELERQKAKEKYQQELSAFNTSKALQIVNATIATALAVIQGLQTGFSIPIVGVGLGPALAAAAGVAGAVQIGIIAAQKPPQPPKFAEGVIGLDGAGNETSDSIDAKLSRGESVMTAKATKRFAPLLAEMELSVGNKPNIQLANKRFAVGYIPMGDGGYASRYAGSQQSNNVAMADVVKDVVRSIPNPVVTVEEINRVNTSAENSVAVSEL